MKEHNFPGVQPKKINFEQGIFESCGQFYYIHLDSMCFERMKKFAELLPVVIYGRKYQDLAMFIHTLRKKMTTGEESLKQTFFEVASDLTSWDQYLLDNASEDPSVYIDDILYFCALMINVKGEDTTKIDEALMREKIDNWKNDINILDLFFFAKGQVPKFKEILQTLSQEAMKNGGKLTKTTIPTD